MTILLILKSIFPFLREWFLKEKALQEIVAQNKLACFLLCCILVMFAVFIRVSDSADKVFDDLNTTNQQLGFNSTLIDDLRNRVVTLEGEKKQLMDHALGKGPAPKDIPEPPSEAVPQTLQLQPDPAKSPKKDPPVKSKPPAQRTRREIEEKSLRDYVEQQLKNL